jgi:hypothetical protein
MSKEPYEEHRVYIIVEKWLVHDDDATLLDETETWLMDQCKTEGEALDKANKYEALLEKLRTISPEMWEHILGIQVWPDFDDWTEWYTLTDALREYAKEAQ